MVVPEKSGVWWLSRQGLEHYLRLHLSQLLLLPSWLPSLPATSLLSLTFYRNGKKREKYFVPSLRLTPSPSLPSFVPSSSPSPPAFLPCLPLRLSPIFRTHWKKMEFFLPSLHLPHLVPLPKSFPFGPPFSQAPCTSTISWISKGRWGHFQEMYEVLEDILACA